jgi:hypothetical protein
MFNYLNDRIHLSVRQIRILTVVLIVAVLGTLLLILSHASTPYASLNADKGTLSGAATVQTDSSASDGKSVLFGSVPSNNSGAVLPNTPDVPASENPSTGWTLEYGDAFGSPSLEEGGQDNTWFPNGTPNCNTAQPYGYPSQQLAYQTCNETSVNPSTGLTVACTYGAPSGAPSRINYACGGAEAAYYDQPSNAYKAFSWKDPVGSGNTIAVQWEWQLPPDYQFDPAIWGFGNYTGADANSGDEIDSNESFGWGYQATSKTDTTATWTNGAYTQPTIVGGSPDNYLTYKFDPSASMHTYTVVYNGSNNTYQSYINGSQIASGSFSSSGAEYQNLIWNMDMRGNFSTCEGSCSDPVTGFTSGSHSLTIRYVGYYEDTAHAGQGVQIQGCPGGKYPCSAGVSPSIIGTPPLIAPGSSVESASATASSYQSINSEYP